MAEENVTTETTEQVDTQKEAVEHPKQEHERTFTRADISKMMAAERTKWESEQSEAIEKAVAEREMRIETHSLLVEKGLPLDFIDIVLTTTAEEVKANIDNLQTIFDKAVEKRVNDRLTQKPPRTGNGSVGMTKADIMAIEDDDERMRLIAENRNLF
ncbi:DUF4355 domain-containing protein [Streptococcus pyogenes]|uniref:DUF4355 domain-containing protein n=1 Tax=Streptococcus pyogenes TaxID=1314 RepID=UPI001C5984F2|nr:DUF4355 domain-containing protein [Streptococcus pyogenes]